MPTPLTPTSSQEIIAISPPHPPASQIASSSSFSLPSAKRRKLHVDPSSSTTLPKVEGWEPPPELREKVMEHLKRQETKEEVMGGKRKATREDVEEERSRAGGMGRERITERMMDTLGKSTNPITNSDLYTRTDHFVSAATGHQQSNRGGGSGGAATYWEVRKAKMEDQARDKKTDVLKGCVFYINGSTGSKVSNLQLQHMITTNGGRFVPMQSSSCTHIIANGGLSGSKTQKWLDGQAGRGGAKRCKIVRVEWVLDSVERGRRVLEREYGVIEHPTQPSLFKALEGKAPKKEEH